MAAPAAAANNEIDHYSAKPPSLMVISLTTGKIESKVSFLVMM